MPQKENIKQSTKTTTKTTAQKQRVSRVSEKNKVTTARVEKVSGASTSKVGKVAIDAVNGLSAVQKATIATVLGVATIAAVAVPVSMHVWDINNPIDVKVAVSIGGDDALNHTMTIDPGTLIADLQPIQKEGYIFKGWYRDANCTIPYEPNYEIQENDMVYALLVEEVNEFTTTLHYNGQEYALEVDTTMTIEDVKAQFLTQLGITEDEFVNLNGMHFTGFFRDNTPNNMYPTGYKMTMEDEHIYALFETNTYRVAFPRIEGVYIKDLEGNELTAKTITHGGQIKFKIEILDGYYAIDEFEVKANGITIFPDENTEVYTVPIFTHIGISVSDVERGNIVSLNIADTATSVFVKEGTTLANALANYDLTEENTMGFYLDENYKEYVDIYNVTLDDDNVTLYTRMATLDKLTISSTGKVQRKTTSISGEVVVPRMCNGIVVDLMENLNSTDTDGWTWFSDYAAFLDCKLITNVYLPHGIKKIDDESFAGCIKLKSIAIPDTVTSIGTKAFYDCASLENIIIPNGISMINTYTFLSCDNLTNIIIPNSVKSIKRGAFQSCKSLTSITIPESVTSIGTYAFSSCKSLTSIIIPESVINIGDSAFSDCTDLTNVVIGSNVTKIGESAFSYCNGLESIIVLKDNKVYYSGESNCIIETVSKTLIAGCKNSVIPTDGSVINIGDSAFKGCESLTNIVIPESIIFIDQKAFSGCTNLTSVTFTVPNGWYVSTSSTATSGIDVTLTDSAQNAIYLTSANYYRDYYWFKSEVVEYDLSVVVGDTITTLKVEEGTTLASILAENNLTEENTMGFYLDENYQEYVDIYNTTIDKEFTLYTRMATLDKLTITDGVVTAKDTTISGEIIIPRIYDGNVISLGEYAFTGCSEIASVIMQDGITNIATSAFAGCSALTSVVIPNTIISIGDCAFEDCVGLTDVVISNSVNSIGELAFYGCTGLTSINIPKGVINIGLDAFYYCISLESIIVEEGNSVYHSEGNCLIETESKTLILGCKNSIIPTDGSVTSIANQAFSDCFGLESITIPNTVISIGNGAFSNCTSITNLHIPDSVISIGESAFGGCTSLIDVSFGRGLKSISIYAFNACENLTTVTFMDPNGWYVSTDEAATSGTEHELSVASQNATYFKSTYCDYYWFKKQV